MNTHQSPQFENLLENVVNLLLLCYTSVACVQVESVVQVVIPLKLLEMLIGIVRKHLEASKKNAEIDNSSYFPVSRF